MDDHLERLYVRYRELKVVRVSSKEREKLSKVISNLVRDCTTTDYIKVRHMKDCENDFLLVTERFTPVLDYLKIGGSDLGLFVWFHSVKKHEIILVTLKNGVKVINQTTKISYFQNKVLYYEPPSTIETLSIVFYLG